mmetsp:Transcript_47315/g.152229  ORF Transcript_47315/g.152229 Transcript_47315/m.152229 type:complete len:268 (+) Transcript_47315:33-836(+)
MVRPRPPIPPPPPAALSYDSYQQGSVCAEDTRRCVQHAIPLIVAAAVLGLVSLLLYLRSRRRRRRRREETVARTLERVPHDAITMAVQCLPVMEHIGGGEVEECRICCEEYAHGSRKRILPCNHAFHPACVDLWLLGSREQGPPRGERVCPICKAPPLDSFLLQASAAALVAGRMRSGGAVRSSLSEQRQQMRLASAAAADAGAGAASAAPAGRVRRLAAAAARFAAGPGLRFIDPHEAAPPGAISRRALARAQSQARRERGAGTEV